MDGFTCSRIDSMECHTMSSFVVMIEASFLTPVGYSPMRLSHGAIARKLLQVLLTHRAARDLALARCWIKHRRRPGTELSIVLEEHTGRGGEIAEAKMGRRILNRQGTGVELARALEHR